MTFLGNERAAKTRWLSPRKEPLKISLAENAKIAKVDWNELRLVGAMSDPWIIQERASASTRLPGVVSSFLARSHDVLGLGRQLDMGWTHTKGMRET